jgi:LysM repeat protein
VRSAQLSRTRKLSGKGRHRRPSPVQKAAQRAAVAGPVVAVSGALAAAPAFASTAHGPQVHQAAPSAASVHTVKAHLDAAMRPVSKTARTYTVRTGDTLAAIAQRFYGHASLWPKLYHANKSKISNPDLIYTGQVLVIPGRHASDASSDQSATDTSDVTSTSSGTSGSTSLSADVQKNIANGNHLLALGQFLVEHGYSKAAAAGIASCVDGESLGNPESVGSGGGGLIGWTPLSSAQPNANIVTGNVAQDMMTQLGDILFYNSNEIGQSMVNELNGLGDPVAAADFYSQHFEKPAVTNGDVVVSVAQQVFSELGG